MDLSRPVVVQRHSYLPIFPHMGGLPMGQKLVKSGSTWAKLAEPISLKPLDGFKPFEVLWNCLYLYLCNTMVIWPWPWIFMVKFWECCISGMEGPIDMERKGCDSIGCYTQFLTFNFDFNHNLDLGFPRSNLEKSRISGMGWPIDMERKRCESIECWTHVVTFNFPLTHDLDLDLGFSRSNLENTVSQEWEGRLTWNQRDVSW